jgi:hypothetical protein
MMGDELTSRFEAVVLTGEIRDLADERHPVSERLDDVRELWELETKAGRLRSREPLVRIANSLETIRDEVKRSGARETFDLLAGQIPQQESRHGIVYRLRRRAQGHRRQ